MQRFLFTPGFVNFGLLIKNAKDEICCFVANALKYNILHKQNKAKFKSLSICKGMKNKPDKRNFF